MPATRQDLFCRLADLQIVTRTVEHEPLFTVAESGKLERELPGAHTKNLFLKDERGSSFLSSLRAPRGSTSRRWRGHCARAVSASASRSF
jgi:hypothetical protein